MFGNFFNFNIKETEDVKTFESLQSGLRLLLIDWFCMRHHLETKIQTKDKYALIYFSRSKRDKKPLCGKQAFSDHSRLGRPGYLCVMNKYVK